LVPRRSPFSTPAPGVILVSAIGFLMVPIGNYGMANRLNATLAP
jgi:hypothetical protein